MMVSSKDIWSPSGHANFELFASKLPEQGTLLEIGSCVGKSTVAWAEAFEKQNKKWHIHTCLLYTSPSPRDRTRSRMPSSA